MFFILPVLGAIAETAAAVTGAALTSAGAIGSTIAAGTAAIGGTVGTATAGAAASAGLEAATAAALGTIATGGTTAACNAAVIDTAINLAIDQWIGNSIYKSGKATGYNVLITTESDVRYESLHSLSREAQHA